MIFKRIRDLREDMDLTQTAVAKATGIDQKTLSNYETGKTNPDSYAIVKLAEFFGVTTDYLLGYECAKKQKNKHIMHKIELIEKELREIKSEL